MILVRPAPVPGLMGRRSMALPEFDPFWSRVVRFGIFVGMHGSDSGYQRYQNEWEGIRGGEMLPFRDKSAFLTILFHMHRPITDTIASLIGHGLCSRFPDLRIAPVESGSNGCATSSGSWRMPTRCPPTSSTRTRSRCSGATSTSTPSTRRTRSAWSRSSGRTGSSSGPDYPHPEGMSDPITFVDELKGLDDSAVRKVMGGNLAGLMHVTDRRDRLDG